MVVGPGTVLGGYRVKHTIGEGGMAIVHLAERITGGETVVLKVLREELVDDADIRRRFLRESRYAEALDHPHVVRVLDSGARGDLLYIAMQHVAGTDLYAMLEDGPLAPDATVAILAQVSGALDAAHAIGLLHRDVKPGNVLVAADEPLRCFLTDFGLSQQITQDSMALTAPGTFVGTLAYMAPEQMLGDDPGAPLDVYALGCVLFECLAGNPPFTGQPLEVMQAHVESEPPKLAKKGSPFPRALDTVIARALAKDPKERWGSCAELVQAAAGALGVPVPAAYTARKDAREPQVAGPSPERSGPLRLQVGAGGTDGTVIDVDGELLIGRGQPWPGSLGGDPELSRRHALVCSNARGFLTVEDLGSRNGTWVNDRRIERLEVVLPGDVISVGGVTLVAVEGPADAHPPARVPPSPSAVPGLKVRITFAPEAGAATLQLDDASEPITLEYRAGVWRVARAGPGSENLHARTPSG